MSAQMRDDLGQHLAQELQATIQLHVNRAKEVLSLSDLTIMLIKVGAGTYAGALLVGMQLRSEELAPKAVWNRIDKVGRVEIDKLRPIMISALEQIESGQVPA